MAGMRMYGLHQKKKSKNDRATSELPSETTGTALGSSRGNEDEYKLVYHQTYKAALFAFRQTIAVAHISQDLLRDMVDQLLELFCVDPSQKLHISDVAQGSFGSEHQLQKGVFDSPSSTQDPQTLTTLFITPRKNATPGNSP